MTCPNVIAMYPRRVRIRPAIPRSLTYRKQPSRNRGRANASRPTRGPMRWAWCWIRSLDAGDDLLHGRDEVVAAEKLAVVADDERLRREDHRHLCHPGYEPPLAHDLRRARVAHELDDLHRELVLAHREIVRRPCGVEDVRRGQGRGGGHGGRLAATHA